MWLGQIDFLGGAGGLEERGEKKDGDGGGDQQRKE